MENKFFLHIKYAESVQTCFECSTMWTETWIQVCLSNMHSSLSQYNPEYSDAYGFYEYTDEVTATENPTDNVGTDTKVNSLAHLKGQGAYQSLWDFLQPSHFHSVWSLIYCSLNLTHPISVALISLVFLCPHMPSLSFYSYHHSKKRCSFYFC